MRVMKGLDLQVRRAGDLEPAICSPGFRRNDAGGKYAKGSGKGTPPKGARRLRRFNVDHCLVFDNGESEGR
jgi:hypothetical protein